MEDFQVIILKNDGNPEVGSLVRLDFLGHMKGISAEKRTDANGSAHFNHYDQSAIEIIVDGQHYGSFRYKSGANIIIRK